ncbi:amidase [Mycena alexandri]|uniref:amidase n=1 Tax=Mycena alexandri TaxID=1745969 RepID=A0AAD6TGL4_9AGAR|nr:amidase [Mycena alexandri]
MWPFSSGHRYQDLSAAKLKQRDGALSAAPKFNSAEHGAFLKATASEIVNHIERGEWTASQVVKAYIARAALAHQTTNCVTEVLFVEALQQAAELDAEFASTKRLRGPLHGVPLSVKDQFHVAGFDASMGFSRLLQKPSSTDADAVALLKAAGAIPIVKTNVPQTMFSFECSNPVFGRTVNPYNAGFTSGGSSGGEGALIGMDGAALGLGSDIGGSLRIPAAYCGIYSLKPSPSRVSYAGTGVVVPGFEAIASVAGPLGRSVKDLELFCRVTFGIPGRSLGFAPILYREPKLPEKLRFGFYSDNYIKASPANKRAVMETVAALRIQGHECLEIEVPDPIEAFDIFIGVTSSDGYQTLLSGIPPDPLDASLKVVARLGDLPRWISVIAAWIVTYIFKDVKFASSIRAGGTKSVREYLKWIDRRNIYNTKFHEEVWVKHELDGIIAPVQSVPQLPNLMSGPLFALAAGTSLYNVVNSPCGVIPVTKVDPAKDLLTEEWTKAPSPSLMERKLYFGKNPVYDPEKMQGMPVAVQIVGRKWEDEKVLAMMQMVDTALTEGKFGAGSWDRR